MAETGRYQTLSKEAAPDRNKLNAQIVITIKVTFAYANNVKHPFIV